MDRNITLSCKTIHTPEGFTYPVPYNVPNEYILSKGCETAWYTKDGNLLADGDISALNNQNLHRLVVGVKPENLTTTECLNGIHYKMTCDEFQFRYEATYHIFSEITEDRTSANLHWLWLLLIILLVGCVCFLLWRHIHSWERVPQVQHGEANEANRDVTGEQDVPSQQQPTS